MYDFQLYINELYLRFFIYVMKSLLDVVIKIKLLCDSKKVQAVYLKE